MLNGMGTEICGHKAIVGVSQLQTNMFWIIATSTMGKRSNMSHFQRNFFHLFFCAWIFAYNLRGNRRIILYTTHRVCVFIEHSARRQRRRRRYFSYGKNTWSDDVGRENSDPPHVGRHFAGFGLPRGERSERAPNFMRIFYLYRYFQE